MLTGQNCGKAHAKYVQSFCVALKSESSQLGRKLGIALRRRSSRRRSSPRSGERRRGPERGRPRRSSGLTNAPNLCWITTGMKPYLYAKVKRPTYPKTAVSHWVRHPASTWNVGSRNEFVVASQHAQFVFQMNFHQGGREIGYPETRVPRSVPR